MISVSLRPNVLPSGDKVTSGNKGEDKGNARLVQLAPATLAAIVFVLVAILGFVAVIAIGTSKMPESGNEPLKTNQVGPPIDNE